MHPLVMFAIAQTEQAETARQSAIRARQLETEAAVVRDRTWARAIAEWAARDAQPTVGTARFGCATA